MESDRLTATHSLDSALQAAVEPLPRFGAWWFKVVFAPRRTAARLWAGEGDASALAFLLVGSLALGVGASSDFARPVLAGGQLPGSLATKLLSPSAWPTEFASAALVPLVLGSLAVEVLSRVLGTRTWVVEWRRILRHAFGASFLFSLCAIVLVATALRIEVAAPHLTGLAALLMVGAALAKLGAWFTPATTAIAAVHHHPKPPRPLRKSITYVSVAVAIPLLVYGIEWSSSASLRAFSMMSGSPAGVQARVIGDIDIDAEGTKAIVRLLVHNDSPEPIVVTGGLLRLCNAAPSGPCAQEPSSLLFEPAVVDAKQIVAVRSVAQVLPAWDVDTTREVSAQLAIETQGVGGREKSRVIDVYATFIPRHHEFAGPP